MKARVEQRPPSLEPIRCRRDAALLIALRPASMSAPTLRARVVHERCLSPLRAPGSVIGAPFW